MDKIMVPVDFSATSSWSFYYAYNLAKAAETELIVVHLYKAVNTDSHSSDMTETVFNEKEYEVLRHLKAATRVPIKDLAEVNVSYIIKPQSSKNTLVSIAAEEQIDLILMGMHGADNTVEKFWGSNTSHVIKNAHCPVLAIPKGAKFSGLKNIAYATDFDKGDTKLLFQLALIAVAINATVHCVHINKADRPYQRKDGDEFKKAFNENFSNLPVTYSIWSANSIEEGLETFCRINEIDILAMLTHKKGLFSKIFGSKSVTQSMSTRTNLPLLSFHN
jgi:nucleotide-binding universal stress UspA family protein